MLSATVMTHIVRNPVSGVNGLSAAPFTIMENEFEYSAVCPVCDKRALDITDLPDTPIRARLKCPHCHKIIEIPLCETPP